MIERLLGEPSAGLIGAGLPQAASSVPPTGERAVAGLGTVRRHRRKLAKEDNLADESTWRAKATRERAAPAAAALASQPKAVLTSNAEAAFRHKTESVFPRAPEEQPTVRVCVEIARTALASVADPQRILPTASLAVIVPSSVPLSPAPLFPTPAPSSFRPAARDLDRSRSVPRSAQQEVRLGTCGRDGICVCYQ